MDFVWLLMSNTSCCELKTDKRHLIKTNDSKKSLNNSINGLMTVWGGGIPWIFIRQNELFLQLINGKFREIFLRVDTDGALS